jgi:hypothetical protein
MIERCETNLHVPPAKRAFPPATTCETPRAAESQTSRPRGSARGAPDGNAGLQTERSKEHGVNESIAPKHRLKPCPSLAATT